MFFVLWSWSSRAATPLASKRSKKLLWWTFRMLSRLKIVWIRQSWIWNPLFWRMNAETAEADHRLWDNMELWECKLIVFWASVQRLCRNLRKKLLLNLAVLHHARLWIALKCNSSISRIPLLWRTRWILITWYSPTNRNGASQNNPWERRTFGSSIQCKLFRYVSLFYSFF